MESVAFEITPEILDQFKTESRENIAYAEKALQSLGQCDETGQAIHELFRSIHTIKGSADYLGLVHLKEIAHSFESILDGLRKASSKIIESKKLEVFLNALDVISDMVASAPKESGETLAACKRGIQALEGIESDGVHFVPNSTEKSESQKTLKIFKDTIEQQVNVLLKVKGKIETVKKIDPVVRGMASRSLQCIAHACQFMGEEQLENLSIELKSWILSPAKSKEPEEAILKIDQYLSVLKVSLNAIYNNRKNEILVKPSNIKNENILEKKFSESQKSVDLRESTSSSEFKTVRVDQNALDGFMNLVGELIVTRNTFSHIQNQLAGTEEERQNALKEFRESSNRLTQITSVLQRGVMEMRMVPIKTLFERYPRVVRDVCRKQGKSVEVIFEGADTEIDKGIADQIAEPLIHLVRNAVDHGIEYANVRLNAGKPEVVMLIMKASHQGNFMVIEVTDDGGGMDVEKIRGKVLEKSLMTQDQLRAASDLEVLNHIFSPGFTTAISVTDISGRGVGLDVVQTNLKKMKGNVSLTTEKGQGTCFRLEVPLTMTIMRALLVKANHAIYALSLQEVSETLKIRHDELKFIRQRCAITVRGEVIMVEWLSRLLGQEEQQIFSPDFRLPVLILQGNGKKFGIIVDSVVKQEEIVVKPLPDSYVGLLGIAGVSILGDGKAILILDSNQLASIMPKAGTGLEGSSSIK